MGFTFFRPQNYKFIVCIIKLIYPPFCIFLNNFCNWLTLNYCHLEIFLIVVLYFLLTFFTKVIKLKYADIV